MQLIDRQKFEQDLLSKFDKTRNPDNPYFDIDRQYFIRDMYKRKRWRGIGRTTTVAVRHLTPEGLRLRSLLKNFKGLGKTPIFYISPPCPKKGKPFAAVHYRVKDAYLEDMTAFHILLDFLEDNGFPRPVLSIRVQRVVLIFRDC